MPTRSIGPITISSEIVWNGKLAFIATDAQGGLDLYTSDGTAAGTVKLGGPYWVSSWINNQKVGDLTPLGSTALYFRVGNLPYLSFGAAGDAIALAPTQFTNPNQGAAWATLYNGKVYFDEYTPQYGTGIYSTDGVNVYYEGSAIAQGQPVLLNGKMLFPGTMQDSLGNYVSGLISSDGTQAGTVVLNSVVASGSPVLSGSKVYFVAQGAGTNNWNLWVSDGTSTGTKMVATIAHNAGMGPAPVLTAVSGGVMWSADDGTHGVQPWFSNGTAAGTYILDINTHGDPSANVVATTAVDVNGKALFMTPTSGASTSTIWLSDGTTAGTQAIGTWDSQASSAEGLSGWTTGGETFFQAFQGSLWVTDGTSAGTKNLGSIGNAYLKAAVDGKLYIGSSSGLQAAGAGGISTVFSGSVDAIESAGDNIFFDSPSGDGVHGAGLYSYNAVSGAATFATSALVNSSSMATLGSKLVFATVNGFNSTLMVSDGTAAGTIDLGVEQTSPDSLQAAGGLVYFRESTAGVGGHQMIWVTDGTVSGTHKLFDAAYENTTPLSIYNYVVAGSEIYYESNSATVSGDYVYHFNVSTSATGMVGAIDSFFAPTVVGDVAYVTKTTGLYRLDPTGETQISAASELRGLTAVGSKLFFEANNGSWGLYVTDGTVAGTVRVADLPNLDSVSLAPLSVVGNRVFFQNTDAVNGLEVWVSDGTVAGTHMVTNTTSAGPGSANASGYVSAGTTTYFTATDGVHGRELWSFSGSGSAAMVADINPGAASSNPTELTPLGGALYFAATGADGVSELWKTTGTGATQVTTTANGANVQDLAVVGSKLYFFGSDSVHGSGLFVSNGTSAGTSFLKGLSQAQAFYAVGSELYFNGARGASGMQLWKSDGTAAGTVDVTGAAAALADNFDGDGKSDVLIENTAGAVVVGEAGASGSETYSQITGLGPEWSFHGAGDFLGEGHSQFLIENAAGQVDIGDVRSGQASFTAVAGLGSEWSFVGAGDFLGDGKADFLIENAAGAVVVGEVGAGNQTAYTTVGALGSEWKFAQSGDFLGEGHAQFLIENAAGQVDIGDVKSGQATYTQVTALGPEWGFVGAGDFLGDGKSDFLIENAAGAVAIGEVVNGQTSFTTVGALGPEWKFVGAGDYLGLGHDQFLIENTAGAYVAGAVQSGRAQYTQLGALGSEWSFRG